MMTIVRTAIRKTDQLLKKPIQLPQAPLVIQQHLKCLNHHSNHNPNPLLKTNGNAHSADT